MVYEIGVVQLDSAHFGHEQEPQYCTAHGSLCSTQWMQLLEGITAVASLLTSHHMRISNKPDEESKAI